MPLEDTIGIFTVPAQKGFTGGVVRRHADAAAILLGRRGGVLRKPSATFADPVQQRRGGVVRKHTQAQTPAPATHGVRASRDVALPGNDGARADKLLEASVKHGGKVLTAIGRAAVKRLLLRGSAALRQDVLFSPAERKQLAGALAATNATAELLGRARIRLRQQQAEKHAGARMFSEDGTDFSCFDDQDDQLKPFPPREALQYFQRLVPTIGVKDPARFGDRLERQAFTLAVDADKAVLSRVQGAISRAMEAGEKISATPRMIDNMLQAGGISPKNPQYSEMVFRTNMKEAYNVGADKERQDPDVIATFPVWRYVGIADGRQRAEHAIHFDKYLTAETSFAEVRDSEFGGEFSGFNCRCDQIPIDKWEWAKLEAAGAELAWAT